MSNNIKNADLTAMPCHTQSTSNSFGGLTKREMFAMHAMQGLLSDTSYADLYNSADEWRKNVSEASVEFADALLAELDK